MSISLNKILNLMCSVPSGYNKDRARCLRFSHKHMPMHDIVLPPTEQSNSPLHPSPWGNSRYGPLHLWSTSLMGHQVVVMVQCNYGPDQLWATT